MINLRYRLPANLENTASVTAEADWMLVQKDGEKFLSKIPAGTFGPMLASSLSGLTDTDTGIAFPGSDVIQFVEGAAECARFTANGNLLLGTTTDTTGFRLQVNGSGLVSGLYGLTDTNTGIAFPGSDVIQFVEGAAECARFTADGEFSCGNGALLKRPGQSTATPVYTFALDADTGAGNNAANCFGVFTAGTLRAYWGGDGSLRAAADTAAKGTYYCGTSAIYWAGVYAQGGALLTSDAREKTDVVDSDLGLTFIQALRPVRYRWVQCGYVDESGQPQTRAGIRPHYGLLAQEVQAVMGESDFAGFAYDPDADAYCLRYDEFIAPLIKAVQELAARVEELEAQLGVGEA